MQIVFVIEVILHRLNTQYPVYTDLLIPTDSPVPYCNIGATTAVYFVLFNWIMFGKDNIWTEHCGNTEQGVERPGQDRLDVQVAAV